MKKRILSLVLAGALCLGLSAPALAAGLDNFGKVNTYTAGQFTDVPADAWFAPNVQAAYELDLMTGSSTTTFNPNGNLTIAEALVLACRLHSTYVGDGETFAANGGIWYQPYVDYAVASGIIAANAYTDYTATATRAQFAAILAATLPDEALPAINSVTSLPDLDASATYATAVLKLYNAGILTGSDSAGSFKPTSTIQRSEVATIVTRMADKSLRKTFTLTAAPTEQQGRSPMRTQADLEGTWSAFYFDGSLYEYTFSGNHFTRVIKRDSASLGYTSYTFHDGTYTMTSEPINGDENVRKITITTTYQQTVGDTQKGFTELDPDTRTLEFTTNLTVPEDCFIWMGATFKRSQPSLLNEYKNVRASVGDRRPSEPDPAVYQYLADYARTNGTKMTYGDYEGQYRCVLDPDQSLYQNEDWDYYLYYDPSADQITLVGDFGLNTKLESGNELLFLGECALILTPDLTTPYKFTYYSSSNDMQHIAYGSSQTASGTIDPAEFKDSTKAVTFDTYEGYLEDDEFDFVGTDEENCAVNLQIMLIALEQDILIDGGYTLTDLGFDMFYA